MPQQRVARRRFLQSSALFASAVWSGRAMSDDRPPVSNPRATDGDGIHEPKWDERLAISVGAEGGDLTGRDDKVIQAAVDYVARLGGGTVRLLPGTYTFRASVFLPSRVRLLGSGADSIITKIPSERVKLAADSDWYDQELTVASPHSFRVGDSVVLMGKDVDGGGSQLVIKRTFVARSGNRFKLDKGLRDNLWLSGQPTCASLFPLLTSEHTSHVTIENLTLDGNGKNNENFNGNYGGCIFLQDCRQYTFREVEARNYNGDGFSFQVCHDVVVDRCHSHDNADLGVHPGSGSQRPLIRNCRMERNTIGLYWCWGVKYGLAEGNKMDANRNYGISIGHNDTDNVMRNNEISNSGRVGILFRDESRGQDFWANRNVIENNRIADSGGADGVAIDVRGQTKDVRIHGNTIRETRQPMNRVGIRINASAGRIDLAENNIDGFAVAIDDRRGTA